MRLSHALARLGRLRQDLEVRRSCYYYCGKLMRFGHQYCRVAPRSPYYRPCGPENGYQEWRHRP